jgi:hypothetical protein
MGPNVPPLGAVPSVGPIFGVSLSSPLLCALADLSPITSHRRPWSVVLWSESHPFGSHSSIGLEVRDFLKQSSPNLLSNANFVLRCEANDYTTTSCEVDRCHHCERVPADRVIAHLCGGRISLEARHSINRRETSGNWAWERGNIRRSF